MFRAFTLACGTFLLLCGSLLLLVDRVVLTESGARHLREAARRVAGPQREHAAAASQTDDDLIVHDTIDPPDWGAFGLMSIGGITMLYALVLPRRRRETEPAPVEDEEEEYDLVTVVRRRH